MTIYESFDAYHSRFTIEPPFDSGDHTIDTLGKFAVVAGLGPESSAAKVNAMAAMSDQALKLMHEQNGTDSFADFLTKTSSQFGRPHKVTRQ